jgi:secreted trypsin-like serine protease
MLREKAYLHFFFNMLFTSLTLGQECGVSFKTPNARIVGGVAAVPNSFPSLALIKFSYKRDITSNGRFLTYTFAASCGGTLISPGVILTASHCIQKDVRLSGQSYPVVLNQYHPTLGSMYKVYLGLQDKSDLNSATLVSIKDVIVVIKIKQNAHLKFPRFLSWNK